MVKRYSVGKPGESVLQKGHKSNFEFERKLSDILEEFDKKEQPQYQGDRIKIATARIKGLIHQYHAGAEFQWWPEERVLYKYLLRVKENWPEEMKVGRNKVSKRLARFLAKAIRDLLDFGDKYTWG